MGYLGFLHAFTIVNDAFFVMNDLMKDLGPHDHDLHDTDNHDGVITHLEQYILEGKVKWALGSITRNKASGGDGISVKLFQTQNMMLLKCCTQYASATGLEKVSFHSSPKERQCQRISNDCTIAFISSSHMLAK